MDGRNLDRRTTLGLLGLVGAGAVLLPPRIALAGEPAFRVTHSGAQWRQLLGAQRYAVLREAATEHPFSSPLLNEHRKGVFSCAGCALPLFASATKFESGTGWPSFWQALPHDVLTRPDRSLLMERTEVLCARCEGHLGHVFDDGPKPTGLRYCINGLALQFRTA